GGTARHVEAVRIAAEARRVAVRPRNGAPHLLDHGEKAAAGVLDLHEIGHHEMRARADEHLRRVAEFPRIPAAPRAAVDEEVDRRARALGDVDVELLDLAWAVRRAPRRAE